jgi:hypothetical protein
MEVGGDGDNVCKPSAIGIIYERFNARRSTLLNALLKVACILELSTHE